MTQIDLVKREKRDLALPMISLYQPSARDCNFLFYRMRSAASMYDEVTAEWWRGFPGFVDLVGGHLK